MKRICVFCGSDSGNNLQIKSATEELGKAIANAELELVYGGGRVGLMGLIADTVLKESGKVIGVIPEHLVAKEVAHTGLTELKIVKTMHERKAIMADLSDAFIALPGGYGTLDEFCEMLTWSKLGFHKKPCAILNADGYFDKLLSFLDDVKEYGFLSQRHRELIIVAEDAGELLKELIHQYV